jgi:hypothetical protein
VAKPQTSRKGMAMYHSGKVAQKSSTTSSDWMPGKGSVLRSQAGQARFIASKAGWRAYRLKEGQTNI